MNGRGATGADRVTPGEDRRGCESPLARLKKTPSYSRSKSVQTHGLCNTSVVIVVSIIAKQPSMSKVNFFLLDTDHVPVFILVMRNNQGYHSAGHNSDLGKKKLTP